GQRQQEGRLAAAGRAPDDRDRAGRKLEVDIAEDAALLARHRPPAQRNRRVVDIVMFGESVRCALHCHGSQSSVPASTRCVPGACAPVHVNADYATVGAGRDGTGRHTSLYSWVTLVNSPVNRNLKAPDVGNRTPRRPPESRNPMRAVISKASKLGQATGTERADRGRRERGADEHG